MVGVRECGTNGGLEGRGGETGSTEVLLVVACDA